MSETGAAPAPPHSHALRPGVTVSWGALPAMPAGAVAVVFVFTLAEPAEMRCQSASALAALPAPTAPQVFIAFSTDAVRDLLAGDASDGAERIRSFITAPASPPLLLPLPPSARLAVDSIHRCPFGGALRAMALTARANDLLIEFLTALANAAHPRLPPLTRSLSEQIHAAAAHLQRHLEIPPALPDLARHFGLSESTLKRGFRQVFDTTVFGYLRARRMERARALLESGEATVLEAAALVGYSNPSNFAAAFRQHFGLNPKAFQLTARRQ